MENKTAKLRRRRVRAQQNIITGLCLACMIFTASWSVYAAINEKNNAQTAVPVSDAAKDKSSAADNASSQTESPSDASYGSFEYDFGTNSAAEDGVHPYAVAQDTEDTLADAVFIGDSRVVGMMNSTDKPMASFICAVGLNIDTVLTSYDITLGDGSTGTLQQALSEKQYGRVYISFGTNEMGWPYLDVFKEHYTTMVETIKSYQPDAQIILLSVLPLTASKDLEGDSVNNTNAKTCTEAIKEVAGELGVEYLDCTAAVCDEYGYLPEDASPDGIHLNSEYCLYWQNFIIDNS